MLYKFNSNSDALVTTSKAPVTTSVALVTRRKKTGKKWKRKPPSRTKRANKRSEGRQQLLATRILAFDESKTMGHCCTSMDYQFRVNKISESCSNSSLELCYQDLGSNKRG